MLRIFFCRRRFPIHDEENVISLTRNLRGFLVKQRRCGLVPLTWGKAASINTAINPRPKSAQKVGILDGDSALVPRWENLMCEHTLTYCVLATDMVPPMFTLLSSPVRVGLQYHTPIMPYTCVGMHGHHPWTSPNFLNRYQRNNCAISITTIDYNGEGQVQTLFLWIKIVAKGYWGPLDLSSPERSGSLRWALHLSGIYGICR